MKKNVHLALCIFLAILASLSVNVFSSVSVSAQETSNSAKGELRALLIAVSRYTAQNFPDLPSVDNDVELMKETLEKSKSGFKGVNIKVLQLAQGRLPSRENILNAVDELAKSCNKEDIAFIMLTGHGLRDIEKEKDYFVPLDANVANLETCVSLDYVIESLKKSKAKFKWLLVDACRSTNKGSSGGIGKLESPNNGMLIFQSSAPGEVSIFTDDQKYSLFIYNFVEGLNGEAVREDGRVTVLDAFEYARAKIAGSQNPVMSSKDFNDFVLAENKYWTQAGICYQKAQGLKDSQEYEEARKQIDIALRLVSDMPRLYSMYYEEAELIYRILELDLNLIPPQTELDTTSTEPDGNIESNTTSIEPNRKIESNDTSIKPSENIETVDWNNAKAGESRSLIIDEIDYVFHYCPGGTYKLGSPKDEKNRESNETPHEVELSPYWTMETEVTQEMWQKVMGDNPSNFEGDDLPVEQISWRDCQKFVEELNEKGVAPKGFVFSLPTEAEWEVMARAETNTAYPWGNDWDKSKANADNGTETTKVGNYPANAWGIFDAIGNVSEWVLDAYGDYPKTDKKDPLNKEGLKRVFRGGCWDSDAASCRAAYRDKGKPTDCFSIVGFRCVLVSESARRQ